MTPQELWDKWVDPYHMISPKDPAKKAFLEDAETLARSEVTTLVEMFEKSEALFDPMTGSYYKQLLADLDKKIEAARGERIPVP